jgi:hypothetical protein
MRLRHPIVAISMATGLLLAGTVTAATAKAPASPVATPLATFSDLGSGSTIGPDGALYVTDGIRGAVDRVDPATGEWKPFATGLPLEQVGIGGAMDVAFMGTTMYVLVTIVAGDVLTPGGPIPLGDGRPNGIYRLESDGSFTVVDDISTWSIAHPPANTDFFLTGGVQYSMQPFRGGFLVTDGHHNRLLWASLDGQITQVGTFTDIVPTGLEAHGNDVFMAEAGPVPHLAQNAKVIALDPRTWAATPVAAGQPGDPVGLTVDVERGPGNQLYALLQGHWGHPNDPANAGMPADAGTGRLVRIGADGSYTTVADHLDRPTSLEIVGHTAFVVSLAGTVTRIDNVG